MSALIVRVTSAPVAFVTKIDVTSSLSGLVARGMSDAHAIPLTDDKLIVSSGVLELLVLMVRFPVASIISSNSWLVSTSTNTCRSVDPSGISSEIELNRPPVFV